MMRPALVQAGAISERRPHASLPKETQLNNCLPRTRTHMARPNLARVRGLFIRSFDACSIRTGRGAAGFFRPAAPTIQSSQRPGFCAALGVGNRHHTALIAGSIIALPDDRPNFGLTSRHQPGSDSRRECPEWRESSCLPHGLNDRSSHVPKAGKERPEAGSEDERDR